MGLKISIIVPIYNIEKFVSRCLDSIINQTYKDFEIIIVNDGSTDNSGKIAKEYKEKYDDKIIYIEKSNGGLSSARNVGIENASGKFIMFVDGDDWIECRCIETLINYIELNKNLDIVEFGYRSVNDYKVISEIKFKEKLIKNRNNVLNEYFFESEIVDMVCNKIYKKRLFEGIRFVEGKIHEDYMITPELLLKAEKILIVKEVFYNYYQRINSITNSNFTEKKLDRLFAGEYVVKFCKKNIIQFEDIAKIKFAFICIYAYNELIKSHNLSKKEKRRYKKIILDRFIALYKSIRHCESFYKIAIYRRYFLILFKINKTLSLFVYTVLRGKKNG